MGVAAFGAALLLFTSTSATGQRALPGHPLTLVVGPTTGPAAAERVDGARSGFSPTRLPAGQLRVLWRRSIAGSIDHAPLVTETGAIEVLTGRGDVLELDSDGTERRRVSAGVGPLGPATLLADGTLVAMTATGDAVAVKHGAVRFRTHVGDRGAPLHVAPIALDDGGVVVASTATAGAGVAETQLTALDATGELRSTVLVRDSVAWPLVATEAGVACVTADGVVYLWVPGRDAVPSGSFGGAIDGVAALGPHTLVAVVDSRRVAALDVLRADREVLATTAAGALLGPPSVKGGQALVMEVSFAATRLITIDRAGVVSTAGLSLGPSAMEADGGIAATRLPVHTATLVDAAGTVAFGGPEGQLGVLSAEGLSVLGETVCARGATPLGFPQPNRPASRATAGRPSAGFAGLVPAGANAFLVACDAGTLLEVSGQ